MSNPVWYPSDEYKKSTRLFQWMKKLGFEDYDTFYKKSVEDIAWFWDEAVKELEIEWDVSYETTLDLSNGIKWPNWFVGGKMNIVHNAVEKWSLNSDMRDEKAITWESDNGENVSYTFSQLSNEINKVAGGLVNQGLKKGDCITLYMPMIPETAILMLAAVKIGAIISPTFSGYGAEAVATRLNASGSKVLVTADGFMRRGKAVAMKEVADRACELAPSVEKLIVVSRLNREIKTNKRDVAWEELRTSNPITKTEVMNSDDPMMLIYTSGTTGKPKGTVHTHAGFPIKAAFDAGVGMDINKKDSLLWVTDMGWMMGPFLLFGALVNGATAVMCEGSPDFPKPDRLWQLIDKHDVTHLGISPTLIRSLMTKGDDWLATSKRETLRVIGSTGEPWNPEPWMWLFEKVGHKKIPIFNYSGGTEIAGGILGNILLKPIGPGTFNSPIPGMAAYVVNEKGEQVQSEVGELVLKKPWVGMTKGFWKEPERYEETYWSKFTDTWVHGDWVSVDSDNYWTITGRSDDTLNIAGKRIGPAEIESVLVEHVAVKEAGVIGVPHDIKGETAVCFVVLVNEKDNSEKLPNELIHHTAAQLGKALKPEAVYIISDLPKTRNGKVMRRAIKAAYLNKDAGDITALENGNVLKEIRNCKKDGK
ncbi:AMP-dependent synthetase [Lottiidibacillus patelloidae]|uniref:acetate--CoA ligase n=1 Tax=Lottiidibacillus patelloidae TaxID=2670334 RepID=A0A263BU66_9BACI|nr:AMP-binding protein [Lottiidibacillus patelloidae]OZM57235.1 AMP-dependent synthetase [Lottiidibacillus patelloidae]